MDLGLFRLLSRLVIAGNEIGKLKFALHFELKTPWWLPRYVSPSVNHILGTKWMLGTFLFYGHISKKPISRLKLYIYLKMF